MSDEPNARDPVGEDKRIDALEERLKAAQEREEKRRNPAAGVKADENYRIGNRVLAELIGGIGGGAFLGWVIDHFARTSPWGLLVAMFLGIIVAFRNIIRISNRRPD
ncbi:MAG: F0F1 ATP synthase assembly protein I [Alphaproteobacteria bacterium]|nr:F0F1 ATP synthase assembly protein I [Alphaproteobacteria bacterium]